MDIKMSDVFTSTTGVCIHVNLSCLHDFKNDGVTPFDMIDKAVSEYDANQALIAKQAEQIKILRKELELSSDRLDAIWSNLGSIGAKNQSKANKIALEATKEQA